MASATHKMVEFFCENFNDNQIFDLEEYVSADFVFSSPMAEALNFHQYSHFVAYLSTSIRFEALNVTSEDDEIFAVEFILDIVDAQADFTGKITAISKLTIINGLVSRIHVSYSGSDAEMNYLRICADGFKQGLSKL